MMFNKFFKWLSNKFSGPQKTIIAPAFSQPKEEPQEPVEEKPKTIEEVFEEPKEFKLIELQKKKKAELFELANSINVKLDSHDTKKIIIEKILSSR